MSVVKVDESSEKLKRKNLIMVDVNAIIRDPQQTGFALLSKRTLSN